MLALNTLQLFTFSLFNQIISAQLTCDSLEYTLSNRRFQEPAGVCYSIGKGESTMLTCNQENNDMQYKYFQDVNCNGNPSLNASVQETMAILGVPESDYTITCCTGEPCDYSIERTYNTATCSDDTSTAPTWTDNVNIINGCSGFFDRGVSNYTICLDNTRVIKHFYANQRSCNGTGETRTIEQGQCNLDGTQIGIICGTAELTCIVTTTTPTVDPTAFPTQQPTEMPTKFTTTSTVITSTKITTNTPTDTPTEQPTVDSDSSDSSSGLHLYSTDSGSIESDSSDASASSESDSSSGLQFYSTDSGSIESDSSDSSASSDSSESDSKVYKAADAYEYGNEQIVGNKIESNESGNIMAITLIGLTCFVIICGLVLGSCVMYGKHNKGHIKVNSIEMDEEIEDETDIDEVKHEEMLNIIAT